ncbi:hypothetical protein PPERSA_07498 [Pseudocohnilembus persalinus]|uniref:Uncharacterized protein n=1 Tax=Pseudocohnilembus persalinus TaxID=266149 RepID=A0A0V0QZQ1_PSEPJ|nr:hypothetical protein PPERSA_07498 [Pseudocohnilembus persalinus]|eukprot:KRX07748.1 hypothetical protein PPERSA_07498 [Pseudocohnilembus persalinus]
MKTSTCTEWLFFHLWKKNPNNLESCPGVFVLDTVIYRWAKPSFWYSTNTQGQIIRKTQGSIKNEDIKRKFNEGNNFNVSAVYIDCKEKEQNQLQVLLEGNKVFQEQLEIEHMEKDDLDFFLFRREKSLNSILQKFIVSKDNHNCLIKVNVNERLCTFEGPEHLLEQESQLSPTIISDIEMSCQNIVRHISDITGNLIVVTRMVLYFKVDTENRLWLMFCTQIKTKNDLHLEKKPQQPIRQLSPEFLMKKEYKTIESHLGKIKANGQGQLEGLLNQFKMHCSNCEKRKPFLYEIQFKNIIDSFNTKVYQNKDTVLPEEMKQMIEFEKNKNWKIKKPQHLTKDLEKDIEQQELRKFVEYEEKQNDYSLHNVPALITKVWGALSDEKYLVLKQNQSWLRNVTKVCDECYLKFTETFLEGNYKRQMKRYQEKLKNQQEHEIDMFIEDEEQWEAQQQKEKDQRAQNIERTKNIAKNSIQFINNVKSMVSIKSGSQQHMDKSKSKKESYRSSIPINKQPSNKYSDNQLSIIKQEDHKQLQKSKSHRETFQQIIKQEKQNSLVSAKEKIQNQNKQNQNSINLSIPDNNKNNQNPQQNQVISSQNHENTSNLQQIDEIQNDKSVLPQNKNLSQNQSQKKFVQQKQHLPTINSGNNLNLKSAYFQAFQQQSGYNTQVPDFVTSPKTVQNKSSANFFRNTHSNEKGEFQNGANNYFLRGNLKKYPKSQQQKTRKQKHLTYSEKLDFENLSRIPRNIASPESFNTQSQFYLQSNPQTREKVSRETNQTQIKNHQNQAFNLNFKPNITGQDSSSQFNLKNSKNTTSAKFFFSGFNKDEYQMIQQRSVKTAASGKSKRKHKNQNQTNLQFYQPSQIYFNKQNVKIPAKKKFNNHMSSFLSNSTQENTILCNCQQNQNNKQQISNRFQHSSSKNYENGVQGVSQNQKFNQCQFCLKKINQVSHQFVMQTVKDMKSIIPQIFDETWSITDNEENKLFNVEGNQKKEENKCFQEKEAQNQPSVDQE